MELAMAVTLAWNDASRVRFESAPAASGPSVPESAAERASLFPIHADTKVGCASVIAWISVRPPVIRL